ncbi:hypothetical protein MUK42_37318 [Musa troglodytarum]|uniref:Uncharacterized protein n=1 Tax=Musa troglodytarum TaxID=320322 RepID=A0A9E7GIZ1_9LILI|nr:hypothetical protein MUK42_37318 [Musa troglodytarum]
MSVTLVVINLQISKIWMRSESSKSTFAFTGSDGFPFIAPPQFQPDKINQIANPWKGRNCFAICIYTA